MALEVEQAPTEELLVQLRTTCDPGLRERIIMRHMDLVHGLAGRYRDRGEPYEDLVQQATIGLINAVDRFDSQRGGKFMTYAVPTILGELKRYFRDKGWAVRVPRRMQELNLKAFKAREALFAKMGRSPTISEIAAQIGAEEGETLEALELARAYASISLNGDRFGSTDERGSDLTLSALIDESENEKFIFDAKIKEAMSVLDQRERLIVQMRYLEQRSQTEVAQKLGISQMHVSRLQRGALVKMRGHLSKRQERQV